MSITRTDQTGDIQKIALRDYSTLIDAVKNAGVLMPDSVRLVLERAITIRKQCAQVIKANSPESIVSNTGHNHFIHVLYDDQLPEPFFVAHCLFFDLDKIRKFVQDTWEEYKDGRIDAMTATVTTNSAMVLGRDLIEQFVSSPDCSSFPDLTNFPRHFSPLFVSIKELICR
jgi:hypothetical protein